MKTKPEGSILDITINSNTIKLQWVDIEFLRVVQKYLSKTNTEFHTVAEQDNRTMKIVIKELLADITDTEVAEESRQAYPTNSSPSYLI